MRKRGRPSELVLFVSVGFYEDPKIIALTVHEREQWVRLLMEQLRSGNGSHVPPHAYGVSKERLGKFLELGLLDEIEGRLHVHKWDEWNGAQAYKRFLNRTRVRRYRDNRAKRYKEPKQGEL